MFRRACFHVSWNRFVFLLGVVDTGAHRQPLGLSESLSIWVEQSPFIRNKLWRRDTVTRDI